MSRVDEVSAVVIGGGDWGCSSSYPLWMKVLVSSNFVVTLSVMGGIVVCFELLQGVSGANRGCLTAMVGGPSSTLAAVRPVLDTFCAKIVHCGEKVGDGHAVKAINNTLAAGRTLAGSS